MSRKEFRDLRPAVGQSGSGIRRIGDERHDTYPFSRQP
jgi:hypothetical protein